MRTPNELSTFTSSLSSTLQAKCSHTTSLPARIFGPENSDCECAQRFRFENRAYAACIPQDFWYLGEDDIEFNREVFDEVIKVYASNLNLALRKGYGLFMQGANGIGKTSFACWILTQVIRRRPYTVYYTTMMRLRKDVQLGFNSGEAKEQLAAMLASDFVVIDELGKETWKAGDSFMRTEFEGLVRDRAQDSKPMIFVSNKQLQALSSEPDAGGYGQTFASIVSSRCKYVTFPDDQDFRPRLGARMSEEMGYDG